MPKARNGIVGLTTEPAANLDKELGSKHAQKLLKLFPRTTPAERIALALELLEENDDRNLIRYRIGVDGLIHSFQAIADANKMTRANAHSRFHGAIARLRKAIDEHLQGQ